MPKLTVLVEHSTCDKCVVLLKDLDQCILLNLAVRHLDMACVFWTSGFPPIALLELHRDPSGIARGTSLWQMLTISQTWQFSDRGAVTAHGTLASRHRGHLSHGSSIDVVLSSQKFGREIWVEHFWRGVGLQVTEAARILISTPVPSYGGIDLASFRWWRTLACLSGRWSYIAFVVVVVVIAVVYHNRVSKVVTSGL
jgi:hypothetical protein